MISPDDIKKLFNQSALDINSDVDEQVFKQVLWAEKRTNNRSQSILQKRRSIMKTPMIRFVTVAVMLVLGAGGLLMWNHTGSGIALADVMAKIQLVNAYTYQMTSTRIDLKGDPPFEYPEQHLKVLISNDYGIKTTMNSLGGHPSNGKMAETYLLVNEKAQLDLFHIDKKYMQAEWDGSDLEKKLQDYRDPRYMVKQILNCKYRNLGRSTIDGIEVEGFHTTDLDYYAGLVDQLDSKIWVDVETQLPVKAEIRIQMNEEDEIRIVVHGFQWDIAVDAEEFNPAIPDDYTNLTETQLKIPAVNEESALQGLRLFVEKTGAYPKDLKITTLMSQDLIDPNEFKPTDRSEEEQSTPSKEQMQEAAQRLMETLMPIRGLIGFYTQLVEQHKDPAYYGHIVGPKDSDKILMHWKHSESEYRIILGNLNAETVSAEVFIELKKELSVE